MLMESRQGTAVEVSNVVHAGLQRAQVYPAQLLPNLRHASERESAQLNLLPGRDVHDSVAQSSRKFRNGPELLTPHEAVRQSTAHHEFDGRRPAVENTKPFQQFFFG